MTMEILRKGSKKNLTIELGKRPEPVAAKPAPRPTLEVAGMAVQNLDENLADQLGYKNQKGVIIVAVDEESIAGLSGLGPGMLIEQVDEQPVEDIQEFENALKAAVNKPPVLFLVNNQGSYRYLVLEVPQL